MSDTDGAREALRELQRRRLDELFGTGCWEPPKQYGNVLVTMPNTDEWRVPDEIWHADFPPTLQGGTLRHSWPRARQFHRQRTPRRVSGCHPEIR